MFCVEGFSSFSSFVRLLFKHWIGKVRTGFKAKKERKFTVKFYMQMEYCGNETLHQFLENRDKNLDRKTIFSLFKQIALGVAHIHKNGIIHRDLKYLYF